MEVDYNKIGFKSGLEIHQQLGSKGKLFCSCPSLLRQDEPDYEIRRKLHAVAGESGEVDIAAQYQASLKKEFIYQGYEDSICLVELDEEPPHKINQEALKIALHISLLLNCQILPITQIMRKTVINGSNTGGFQRTVMIGHSGWVETEKGKVRVEAVFLEEDSAREMGKTSDGGIFWRLDRLGIPLVEIATAPDIKSPEQIREVALHIGNILRSCRVKRGIGTIRQDINMSVKGGERVEIKGFQDVKMMLPTVDNEIQRQLKLVKNKKSISEVRNALPNGETEFIRPMPGSARMYPETDLPLLKISRQMINEAKKTLPKLRSEIEKELMKEGLSQEMIRGIFKEDKLREYKELLVVLHKPQLVAKILLVWFKDIVSREKVKGELTMENLKFILKSVKKKKIREEDIKEVMREIIKGKSIEEAIKLEKIDIGDVEEEIRKIIKSKPGLSDKAYMGLVMNEFKGKVDGRGAMEIIKKYVK